MSIAPTGLKSVRHSVAELPQNGSLKAATVEHVIQPGTDWKAFDFREWWKHRELLYFLAWRDVKVRYKQTVLGVLWAVLQPLLTMLAFSIFFGRLGGMEQHVEFAYPVVVFVGLLPWQFFSSAVAQSSQSLISNSSLIGKVYFPRILVPLSSLGSTLVDTLISFAVLIPLMLFYEIPFTANLLALPVCLVGVMITAMGIGTLLSALTVSYRDFRYIVPFFIQLGLFASPVAYPYSVIPEKWRLVYALNPMAGTISAFRSAFLGQPFLWEPIAISSLVAVLLLFVGSVYFHRVERQFADVI